MLRDQLFNHPSTIFIAFSAIIPMGGWVVVLINWMVQGETEPVTGIFAILAALVLMIACLLPQFVEWVPYLAMAAWGTLAIFPIVKHMYDRKEMHDIEVEAVEKVYLELGRQPKNDPLKFRLARSLYQVGMVDAAISIGSRAIESMPRRFFQDDHRALEGWKLHASRHPAKSYSCIHCGHFNSPGEVFCQGCGSPIYVDQLRGRIAGPQTMKKIVAVWSAMLLIGIGVPASFAALPEFVAAVVAIVLIGVAGFGLKTGFQSAQAET